MAARKSKNGAANLPKGFVLARTRLDGFFERKPGNAVLGILRGVMKTNGKFGTKNVFRIQVTEGETEIGEGELVGPGALVGLDEPGYPSALAELDAGCLVYVRYEGLENPKAPGSTTNPHIFTVAKQE